MNPLEKIKGLVNPTEPLVPAQPAPIQQQPAKETLDPQAVNMAKAIRQHESGGNFQARGRSREYGAYQYTPETWAGDSKAFLGRDVPLESATPEEQNEVAYKKIKSLKDKGYNAGQVASIWNSGQPEWEGKIGVNQYGVEYNVPAYVDAVNSLYQTYKSQTPEGVPAQEAQGVEGVKEPTLGGNIVRGLIKTPARIATNLINAGQVATGNAPTQPFSGSYLGEVKPIGTEGSFGQKLKEATGAGLELSSYLIGGGQAKAGLQAAKAGELFIQGVLKTAGKGALEGAASGTLAGAGQGLSENGNLSDVASSTVKGTIFGTAVGGILGTLGGAIAKSKGITEKTIDGVKSKVGKDYLESLSSTVSGRKVLAENAEGMNASLEAGILPDVVNGRYDTREATNKLQDMMDKLGEGRGADIKAQNKPVDVGALKANVMNNVNQYVADPLEKQKVVKTINDWFDALGDKPVDLETLNKKQIAAGKLSKFDSNSDASVRNAYRNIYHGLGKYINEAVSGTGGVNKEINDTLTKYHGIMNFLDNINEHKVLDDGVASILASHAAKTAATGAGAAFGGAGGAIIASETVPIVEKFVRKIFGQDNAAYQKVMEAIRSGEQKKIDAILKQVEKNKGTQVMREIQRKLTEVKQLTTGVLSKGKKAEVYTPIIKGAPTSFEAPAQKITRQKTGLLGLPKPGETSYRIEQPKSGAGLSKSKKSLGLDAVENAKINRTTKRTMSQGLSAYKASGYFKK